LGIVDAFITAGGTQIAFAGRGLETDVGERLPSPTKGMSIDEQIIEGGNEVEDLFAAPQQEGFVPAPRPVRRVVVPEPEEVEEVIIEPREEGTRDENADLFQVTEEDIMGSPSDNPKQELDDEDMDDLFGVSEEDVMGEPPRRPAPRRRLIRRTSRPYYPPQQSIIGPR